MAEQNKDRELNIDATGIDNSDGTDPLQQGFIETFGEPEAASGINLDSNQIYRKGSRE
ncbi:hypothetical protein [Bacillus sp. T33-2]|uniref:hypothetical protein n=1 Tax=Bacillus sp. T33-2 TaxID=2054168 RepID=UPI0015E0760A|nr:hypothetical protein [Bacillus sp. T33-2]